jgi:hypothetical protein
VAAYSVKKYRGSENESLTLRKLVINGLKVVFDDAASRMLASIDFKTGGYFKVAKDNLLNLRSGRSGPFNRLLKEKTRIAFAPGTSINR